MRTIATQFAAFVLAACAASMQCPIHNILSPMARDEYPNGKHVRVFAHGLGAQRHEFSVMCN